MTRYKLTVEYDGSAYAGWQRQAGVPSIQQSLEEAVFALTGVETYVQGAGRTDAGVHARGQVAHVDIEKPLTAEKVRDALNFHLRPQPIAVLVAEAVHDTFQARHDALHRVYRYVIINRRAPLTLEAERAWRWHAPLDEAAMHEAAQALTGKHDFTAFRAAQCQAKSPVRTLDRITVTRESDHVFIDCEARSFLHSQVRAMAGSLKLVGEGKWPVSEIASVLASRDRARCGPVAPACGLYLMHVGY